ncbi:hypothetical protein E8E13_003810 [Curvularia kusanoi]|uniref:DUF6590 domain-containing protein n=1 Tax=Curvularia kusanoi TaxID=90978 RepID=A0A9P4W4Z0_CURKU|nr:hypothetical protein E8E13_003810 [Curvularia kusanoi]
MPQQTRPDSVVEPDPPAPVPQETRAVLPNFIAGTPETGWYDRLDPSYRMRTGAEARQFFKKGRVFAMLYSEPAGETARFDPHNDAYTTVRFGEAVFTQIRRFVIVSVRRGFVYACAIATYGGQGTRKHGCNPAEHAVICNTGVDPRTCLLPGESLPKEGIQVDPPEQADSNSYLSTKSRLRFGKAYTIEWNVKVKDIGTVAARDMARLLQYYQDEDREIN